MKMMSRRSWLQLATLFCLGLMMLSLGACGSDDNNTVYVRLDPRTPWTKTATASAWLTANPYPDKHDGGWVYSAREKRIYAMYGQDAEGTGRTLYRIDHINETSEVATTFTYGRHGSQPVIDDTDTYIYMPPSESTNQLERYNTRTNVLETLAPAPFSSTYSHAAWKDDKLWIVLDDFNLYSYNPATNSWSAALNNFGNLSNIAASGPRSHLIYVMVSGGHLFSYDTTDGTVTALPDHPNGFDLGGNNEFTWFGYRTGYLYAAENYGGNPAIFSIADGTWYQLDDPKAPDSWAGHATFDSTRNRLYITGASNEVWYYQY